MSELGVSVNGGEYHNHAAWKSTDDPVADLLLWESRKEHALQAFTAGTITTEQCHDYIRAIDRYKDRLDKELDEQDTATRVKGAKVEGYWRSTQSSRSKYPWPEPRHDRFFTKKHFLAMLKVAEGQSRASRFADASTCRLCGIANGRLEFRLRDWIWPEGFAHYVDAHGIIPSIQFRIFINCLPRTILDVYDCCRESPQ